MSARDSSALPNRETMLVAYLDHRWTPAGELDGYAQYRDSVELLADALRSDGFDAAPFDVGPTPQLLAERLTPAVTVFNFVERIGSGPFPRPWYVPDVALACGARYIGPPSSTLDLVADKARSKTACAGLLSTPPAVALHDLDFDPHDVLDAVGLPALVKPNFEAGSLGVADDVVVDTPARLSAVVARQLRRFPLGVLVEAFIDGHDLTVGFVDVAGERIFLPPVLYRPEALRSSRRRMYDYQAKNAIDHHEAQRAGKHAECPATIATELRAELESASGSAADALGVRGFGRADFRLSLDGRGHFLEMNALPDVDPTAGFAIASRVAGVTLRTVVRAVIDSYGTIARAGVED